MEFDVSYKFDEKAYNELIGVIDKMNRKELNDFCVFMLEKIYDTRNSKKNYQKGVNNFRLLTGLGVGLMIVSPLADGIITGLVCALGFTTALAGDRFSLSQKSYVKLCKDQEKVMQLIIQHVQNRIIEKVNEEDEILQTKGVKPFERER